MISPFDVIVIGSGPAGVHAAYPLVEAGLSVGMVDGGLKKNDATQTRSRKLYASHSNAYDLLSNSNYIFNKTYHLLQIKSNIEIIQTLGIGGLSEIWHGICDRFSKEELIRIGLPVEEMQVEYDEIARRIELNSKPTLDVHGKILLKKDGNNKKNRKTLYRLSIASDYRTKNDVERLMKFKNFSYIPNRLVFAVKEKSGFVEIQTQSIDTGQASNYHANYIMLAAGSINTTRILLRSFGLLNRRTSFLTKSHYMIVNLHLRTLFERTPKETLAVGQIGMNGNTTQDGMDEYFVQFYKSNILAKDKAIKYIPLPPRIASILYSILARSLVIADVRFPTEQSEHRYCILKKAKNQFGILNVFSKESQVELRRHKTAISKIKKKLFSFGLIPLKTLRSDVTSHYAGGIPMSVVPQKLSTDSTGKLHQAKRIFIADSATWRSLPGRSPTFTIMANASRVSKNVLRVIRG